MTSGAGVCITAEFMSSKPALCRLPAVQHPTISAAALPLLPRLADATCCHRCGASAAAATAQLQPLLRRLQMRRLFLTARPACASEQAHPSGPLGCCAASLYAAQRPSCLNRSSYATLSALQAGLYVTHRPTCLSMSSILVWNTGSTASTLTPVPLWGIANTSTTWGWGCRWVSTAARCSPALQQPTHGTNAPTECRPPAPRTLTV